jgi:serine/threonine protein kinase
LVVSKPITSSGPETAISNDLIVPYRPRNYWKGDVRFGNGWVEKDYESSPLLARLYGRISLHWEETALKRLRGIEGVPEYLGRPTRNSIRMTRVPGIPIDKMKAEEISELFLKCLQDLVSKIHSRGVAHGDLHMRNILINEDKAYLIDFSTAYTLGRVPFLDRGFFRIFRLLDLERIYKIEKRFFGRGTPPEMFYIYRLVKGKK